MRPCQSTNRLRDHEQHDCCQSDRLPRRQKQSHAKTKTAAFLTVLAASLPVSMAQQNCVSLRGSTTCPAFSGASINTALTGDYPFLSFVNDVQSFDDRLRNYIATSYAQRQYQNILGCSSVNLTNTTALYARYTTTVLCNAIVQSSRQSCGSSGSNATPLCAGACADFAISEQVIVSSPELCGRPGNNAIPQIRSDFARCSNPAEALSGNCITAVQNEPTECGYQGNLRGLCMFCADSTINSTDSCCVTANVESRCANVNLPTTVSMPPLFPSSTSSSVPSASGSAGQGTSRSGLSGGAIAGIVLGSILGAALILAAVIFCCIRMRKNKPNPADSIFNTPSPTRQSLKGPPPPMAYGGDGQRPPSIVPGARVQRMAALEGSTSSGEPSERGVLSAFGGSQVGAYDSPETIRGHLAGALPRRQGSLSSHSALGSSTNSPLSGSDQARNFSSPDGVASGQSEQLQFFKDYYSQDDIHPNDTVATLWAYQPRAGDEFELERGDMLKVVGIWDDGWATGVRISETAEQWEARKSEQRDSGVSNTTRRSRPETDSEIKAFPLVCVCLPQHWRKTIEGDSTDTGRRSGGDRPPPSP
ncbi:hypothetical protein HBI56_134680 [Parastagonospora nodorum]|uniref:SH3 domain-containing protein n=2 Tax=Phaeosphaeria nodorum (strain SN15 / ATCC MYA-4574 / FGSC 10173) TaxID=321614 RepID=A0A7U2I4V8_PHANO|nr:hypothetical protein SNOG_06842 [Parastagonospora nodorum SN15]KAH3918528.1 hypothetical protein HBH56_037780 [Parastagonospora nodorum]EAT85493.2 hypothetical protein SNOG_06842 [Parastagonospora nodorum SN15]KAH3933738.1 hypothetical protein HBH54_061680 [Parastagonospora nodorum]KAH3952518.1 hypothetical protein HBH53_048430 [Parastagonospora nodorum]KAH3979521.1 hypothetical protein HBH51_059430 [Parastagonospora nodorum]